jgi:hypothetical protein
MPPKNKLDDFDTARLAQAMRRSRQVLRKYRMERTEAVRQYIGKHWSEEANPKKVPLNLINQYCRIVGKKLVGHNPRVMLSTFDRSSAPEVAKMEAWMNKEIPELRVAKTLQRVVLDGLFSLGIIKVGLATPSDAARVGWKLPAGSPFCDRVDFDDFVFDIQARDFEEVSWIGHRIRVPLATVRDSKLYDSKQRKQLSPTQNPLYNAEGDERISTLGRTALAGSDAEEFEDHVDLWEIYLPRHGVIITLPDESDSGIADGSLSEPLRTQRWLGPDCGPYHLLMFDVTPGNTMPVGPIMNLIDLHDGVNEMMRKLLRQAARQKDVTAVAGGATEDGSRVIEANDGQMIRVDNPENIVNLKFGGPDQQLFALMTAFKDLFSWSAGNLDSLGGLSPQAKTASQDDLLSKNSSAMVGDMQATVVDYTADVMKALAWYWWHDPIRTMSVTHKSPNGHAVIQRTSTPQQRQRLSFYDIDLQIDPYSLQHATPESRIAALTQIVQGTLVPMLPLLQQQGIVLDINGYLSKMAKYLNIPDLTEIISIAEPPMPPDQEGTSGQPQLGPQAQQPKTQMRETRPGRTPQGDQQDNLARMMAQNKGGNPATTTKVAPMMGGGR